jgi:hypothetical protein
MHHAWIEDKWETACMCPQGIQSCMHLQFLEEYGAERFPPVGTEALAKCKFFPESDCTANLMCHFVASDPAVLFLRQPLGANQFWNDFSVNTMHLRTPKSRVFVTHKGEDVCGTWACTCNEVLCAHITTAKEHMAVLLKVDVSALSEEMDQDAGLCHTDFQTDTKLMLLRRRSSPRTKGSQRVHGCIAPASSPSTMGNASFRHNSLPTQQAPAAFSRDLPFRLDIDMPLWP